MSAALPTSAFVAILAVAMMAGAVLGLVLGTWMMGRRRAVLPLAEVSDPPRWRLILADPTAQRAIVRIVAAGIGFGVKWAYARDIPAEHLEPALLAVLQGVNTLFDVLLGAMATTGVIGLRRSGR